jgi:hypothetical protein
MYEFKPATERIKHLRELIRDRSLRIDAERAMNLDRGKQEI